MNQKPCVAQDLQLLANLIADVAVVGMEFFQFAFKCVNLGGGKCVGRDIALRCPDAAARRPYLGNASHNIQHVQGPAALGDGNVF